MKSEPSQKGKNFAELDKLSFSDAVFNTVVFSLHTWEALSALLPDDW